jgi:diguanylate cyclase (GGDEF)-like protein/PAS domain S-box-containing protein
MQDSRHSHIERLVDAIDLPIGRWSCAEAGKDALLSFCNRPYLAWACRPRDALIGRSLAEIYGEPAWAAARDAFAEAFGGHTTYYERQLTHLAGPARWARVQVFPDIDPQGRVEAVYTIAFDVHDYRMQREALEASRRRLDRFTENIPYPLTYVDRGFVIRFVNKAYCAATGVDAEQLVGQHIGKVRGARRWAEHEPYFERAVLGQPVQYTRLVELVDQGPRWLRTSYVPDFGDDGEVVGLYTVTMDVHELTVAQEGLRRSVERDAVTDVLSRRTIMDRIDAALSEAAVSPVALFFVDLDGFKAVNDALGHREGDALLVRVGRALQDAVRADDAVGRFGGDEFLVLAHVRDANGARALAAHLLEALVASVNDLPPSHRVTASIGYALAPDDAQSPHKLLQRADDAMYAAKRLGKNRAVHCRGAVTAPLGVSAAG